MVKGTRDKERGREGAKESERERQRERKYRRLESHHFNVHSFDMCEPCLCASSHKAEEREIEREKEIGIEKERERDVAWKNPEIDAAEGGEM